MYNILATYDIYWTQRKAIWRAGIQCNKLIQIQSKLLPDQDAQSMCDITNSTTLTFAGSGRRYYFLRNWTKYRNKLRVIEVIETTWHSEQTRGKILFAPSRLSAMSSILHRKGARIRKMYFAVPTKYIISTISIDGVHHKMSSQFCRVVGAAWYDPNHPMIMAVFLCRCIWNGCWCTQKLRLFLRIGNALCLARFCWRLKCGMTRPSGMLTIVRSSKTSQSTTCKTHAHIIFLRTCKTYAHIIFLMTCKTHAYIIFLMTCKIHAHIIFLMTCKAHAHIIFLMTCKTCAHIIFLVRLTLILSSL